MRRWQREVTCEETRAPLGVEPPRQGTAWAIAPPTPALCGRYSLVTLRAPDLFQKEGQSLRTAPWDVKTRPTFSDALAGIRRALGSTCPFSLSTFTDDMGKVPRSVFERLPDTVCYAA